MVTTPDDNALRAAVAAFPPAWRELFAALRIDLATEAGRKKLTRMKKLDVIGMLPRRVPAKPLCARIDTLEPLALCTALTEIHLCAAPYSDLSPLRAMRELRQLILWQTNIASLEPLAGMEKLRLLSVWCTAISDLAPVATLHALEELSVEYTNVRDLGPLAGLRKLALLDLSGTAVTDLSPLERVPLWTLRVYRTSIPEASLAAFRASHPGCGVEQGDAYPPREVRCGC
jgi:Leucine-rich repeat (LRR) protein